MLIRYIDVHYWRWLKLLYCLFNRNISGWVEARRNFHSIVNCRSLKFSSRRRVIQEKISFSTWTVCSSGKRENVSICSALNVQNVSFPRKLTKWYFLISQKHAAYSSRMLVDFVACTTKIIILYSPWLGDSTSNETFSLSSQVSGRFSSKFIYMVLQTNWACKLYILYYQLIQFSVFFLHN